MSLDALADPVLSPLPLPESLDPDPDPDPLEEPAHGSSDVDEPPDDDDPDDESEPDESEPDDESWNLLLLRDDDPFELSLLPDPDPDELPDPLPLPGGHNVDWGCSAGSTVSLFLFCFFDMYDTHRVIF